MHLCGPGLQANAAPNAPQTPERWRLLRARGLPASRRTARAIPPCMQVSWRLAGALPCGSLWSSRAAAAGCRVRARFHLIVHHCSEWPQTSAPQTWPHHKHTWTVDRCQHAVYVRGAVLAQANAAAECAACIVCAIAYRTPRPHGVVVAVRVMRPQLASKQCAHGDGLKTCHDNMPRSAVHSAQHGKQGADGVVPCALQAGCLSR